MVDLFVPKFSLPVPAFNDLGDLGMLSEFSPTVKQTILEGVLKEPGTRSIEEVECEHHTMLLEWLARRAKVDKG